jgi:RND superfamily putative drug exporter
VLGHQDLTYYVPFAAAVLLLSLGSDYNIFIAGRIWQESERRPFREAIRYATPRASRTITVAGVTLAGSFALLALIPIRPMRELAFVMAAGILIDSFVVRSTLVPSLAAAFGRISWWPSSPPRGEAAEGRVSAPSGTGGSAPASRARGPRVGASPGGRRS